MVSQRRRCRVVLSSASSASILDIISTDDTSVSGVTRRAALRSALSEPPKFQPRLSDYRLYKALDQIWSEGPSHIARSTVQEARYLVSRGATIALHGSCMEPRCIHKSEGVISVRCRRCRSCINKRRFEWLVRSTIEAYLAERTWFVTLTFRPYSRLWLEREADALTSPTDVAYALISPWIKKVRKNSSAPLKYISVVEMHKDGSPHLHALVFQTTNSRLLWKHLVKSWNYGFATAKLANPSSARYVCKYLGKQMKKNTRIRVSRPFGRQGDDLFE